MKKSTKHWAAILVMFAAIFTFFSCDKDDGDWDPMVWKAEVPVVKSGDSFEVSDRGGCDVGRNTSFPRTNISGYRN